MYEREGTLYAPIGMHAGGIFVLQLYGLVTTAAPGVDSRVWGTGRLVDGWSALGTLVAVAGLGAVGRAHRHPTRRWTAPAAARPRGASPRVPLERPAAAIPRLAPAVVVGDALSAGVRLADVGHAPALSSRG
ncbi:MAG TPA: hypothetical protein VGD56_20230 [Gemmatirosa sp.]